MKPIPEIMKEKPAFLFGKRTVLIYRKHLLLYMWPLIKTTATSTMV